MTLDDPPARRPLPALQRVIDSYDGAPCTFLRPVDAPVRPGEPCGEIHDRCRGHQGRWRWADGAKVPNPDYGDPCGQPARAGGLKCRHHLKGKRERERAAMAAIVENSRGPVGRLLAITKEHYLGMPPTDVLADALARAAGMAAALEIRLGALDEEADADAVIDTSGPGDVRVAVNVHSAGLVGPNSVGDIRVHALLPEFREWVKLSAGVAKQVIDAGLEERKAAMTAAQGAVLLEIVQRTFAAVGVEFTDDVRQAFGREVAAHPEAIESTASEVVMVDRADLVWDDDWDSDEDIEVDRIGPDIASPQVSLGVAEDASEDTPPSSGASWLDAFGGPS